jgi:hypothetical protein
MSERSDQTTGLARPPGERISGPVGVHPAPTDEEAAAIMVALDTHWPRVDEDEAAARRASAWKFSGRWWSQPIPLRRARPWV